MARASTLLDVIVVFENGELNEAGTLALFATLIADGTVWKLQGAYGRYAQVLIDNGLVDEAGVITPKGQEIVDAQQ